MEVTLPCLGHYWYFKYYFSAYSDAWYLSLFDKEDKVCGEITPSYSMLDDCDILSIKQLNPNLKILLLVRNPIQRSWSQYKFDRLKKFPSPVLEDEDGLRRYFHGYSQFGRSNCFETIHKFQKHFWGSKFMVCFYDAIIWQPQLLLQEIADFLCVDRISSDLPKVHQRVNASFELEMPEHVRNILTELYTPIIRSLAVTYGSYFNVWLDDLDSKVSTITDQSLCLSFQVPKQP